MKKDCQFNTEMLFKTSINHMKRLGFLFFLACLFFFHRLLCSKKQRRYRRREGLALGGKLECHSIFSLSSRSWSLVFPQQARYRSSCFGPTIPPIFRRLQLTATGGGGIGSDLRQGCRTERVFLFWLLFSLT